MISQESFHPATPTREVRKTLLFPIRCPSFSRPAPNFPGNTTAPPLAVQNQVAARLGASVAITDQSKMLPTLTRNARSNTRGLECCRLPASPACRVGAGTSPPADATDLPENNGSKASPDGVSPATAAFLASAGLPSALGGEGGGCDTARVGSAEKGSGDRGHAGDEGGVGAKGRWLATELLFSDSEEDMLRWRGSAAGRGGGAASGVAEVDNGDGGGDLFDLVVAADVVYLNDLWDAMAFTIKVLVSQDAQYGSACRRILHTSSQPARIQSK